MYVVNSEIDIASKKKINKNKTSTEQNETNNTYICSSTD